VRVQRSWRQLALDIIFVAWVLHVLVTGRIVPERLSALFTDEPQVVASSEPAPEQAPAPLEEHESPTT